MTILVTGGAGYIGSHMVHELVDAGEEVLVLDNLSTGFASAVPESVRLVVGETGDQPLVMRLIREHGIEALIECAVKGGVRHFIFSSTCAVYGNPAVIPVTEDAPTLPVSPYGWSKLMTEIMLRDASYAHGLAYVTLRYFNVAGADPCCRTGQSTTAATQLIKVAAETALGLRPKLDIFGIDYPTPDGTCIRDYIHVSDLVRAHSDALKHLRSGAPSLTLNCGYGRGFSVREVVDAIRRVSGVDFKVEIAPRRPGDPAHIVAAIDQVREALGWQPHFDDLSTIVSHALAWERELTARQKKQSGQANELKMNLQSNL